MERQWTIKPLADDISAEKLANELNIDPTLAHLLLQRDIKTFEEARKFFNPSLSDLHDPFLMNGMKEAVVRIKQAIDNNENILVYGDYDVDGTTSIALVYSFLKEFYPNVKYYVPERYSEGYGISYKGIDFAYENNLTLVIALDCGIKAVEKIIYATEKGIDFIICDHHLPGEVIPDAVAVLDPKKPNCDYPYKDLSGCGIGFKLVEAYCIENQINIEKAYQFLDLVAVSIASDIVPITGENRILAFHGLNLLNNSPSTGLKAIRESANIDKAQVLNINDIVFKIGPRINAAGRIRQGSLAVDLLTASNYINALSQAKNINECNDERKDIDQNIFKEALQIIEDDETSSTKKYTIVYRPDWHKGVVGIVASRLIEHHYKPTIVFTRSNGYITGSARSVDGFDLYKAIESCSDILENYGGHMFAAGLTLLASNFDEFIKRFSNYVENNILPEQLIPRIEIDAEINLSQINQNFYRVLERFQPYGPGNMTPVFAAYRVFDSGYGRTVGKNNDHLKLDLKHECCPKTIFPSIAFNLGHIVEKVAVCKHFNVCFSIEKNEFMGNTSLQLRIRDIQFK